MIYLDTSVALAQLLAEDRHPPLSLWQESLFSSRLLEFELWNRLHARRLTRSHGGIARDLMQRIAFLELSPTVLARALEPFPVPVRTLDGLHLATADFLRTQGVEVRLATFDLRMREVAQRMSIPAFDF